MSTRGKRFSRAVSRLSWSLLLILAAAAPAGATAQREHCLRQLGNRPASRLYRKAPLKTAAQLKKAFADPKFQQAVQTVFDEAKLGPVAANLIGAVAALPDDAQPKDIPVGTKMDWMAYRKHGKPRLLDDACWAGKKPFQGWLFSVPGGPDGNVDLIVPVPCGNIARIEPPTCVLKVEKNGDTAILDLTDSRPGGVPIASYGSRPELPQNPSGKFQVAAPPKCEPGAKCAPLQEELWAEDVLGLRSAASQCTYPVPVPLQPPVCKLKVTYDDNGVFRLDATGSGVAVQSIAVSGKGPNGAQGKGTMTGDQRTTEVALKPEVSGDWTWSADVLGVNDLHSAPGCDSTVRVCVPPTAKVELAPPPPYSCENRRLAIDVTGSSKHRVVTVTGPGGAETLSGDGPTFPYEVKRSGKYTIEVTADDGICPEKKAKAATSIEVAPFGDSARWTFRAVGAYTLASQKVFRETQNAGTALEERRKLDLGGHYGGFGAGVEYRPLHVCDLCRWGIALDVLHSQLDTHLVVDLPKAWGIGEESLTFTPVLLSLNYHFTSGKGADFFLGPTVGYAFLGSVGFNAAGSPFRERFQDDFTYGLNLGLDVPFGAEHNYAFTAGVRQLFLKAKAKGSSSFSFDLNPTIATAGIAFRFR